MGKTLFALVCFALAGLVFFFYTKPAYATVGDLQAQIAQYQEALDKAAQLQALKQKLLTRFNSFAPDDVTRLQTFLPDHVDNIGLILDLDSLASHYGMALENVDVATAQSATAKQSAVGAIGPSAQKYDSLTLHFGTYGTYDNFRVFITDLEQSLRVVDLISLTIAQQSTPGATGPSSNSAYRYDMTIKTYWLK